MKNEFKIGDVVFLEKGKKIFLSPTTESTTEDKFLLDHPPVIGKLYSAQDSIEQERQSIKADIKKKYPKFSPSKVDELVDTGFQDSSSTFIIPVGEYVVTHVVQNSEGVQVDCKALNEKGKWDPKGVEVYFYPIADQIMQFRFPKTGRTMKMKFE